MLSPICLPHRGSQSLFVRPSQAHDALIDDVVRQPGCIGPLSKRLGLAVQGCEDAVTAIIGLHLPCGPTAVFRGIVAIVVDSIELIFRRGRLAHVGKEVLEGVPAFADGYTTTSVASVRAICWILTSLRHLRPCVVDMSFRHAVGSMFGSLKLRTPTAARRCRAVSQSFGRYNSFLAARTATQPTRPAFMSVGGRRNYGQASKCLSNKINLAHVLTSDSDYITSAVDMQKMAVRGDYVIP